jgi:hypothetical protein
MFISRIEGSEVDDVSEKTKTYFTKIRLSANKMQTLLIDLVNYSRTIKGDDLCGCRFKRIHRYRRTFVKH